MWFEDVLVADEPGSTPPLCLMDVEADRSLLWVAPQSGTYQTALWSDVPASMAVSEGKCDGSLIACVPNNFGLQPIFDAIAGDAFTFVIEAEQTTPFQLQIELMPVSPSCPVGELFGPSSIVGGSTFGAANEFGSDCGGFESNDQAWIFIPEVSGIYRFDTAGSNFDTILEVFDDFCGGSVIACIDDNPMDTFAVLDVELEAGHVYTIVVDGFGGQSGDYQLALDLIEPIDPGCGTAMPVGVPSQTSGTTNGSNNDSDGSCSFNPAPELEFWWTAPATGTYVISTEGSNFDTLLYVRDGGCDGVELGCSDDWFDLWSQVQVDLVAGQTISIFMDGFSGAGSFDLSITAG